MSLRIWILVMLSILLIMPRTSVELLTGEEIDSMIEPGMLYPGLDVREFAKTLILQAREEIKRTAEEAAAEAVIPLEGDIAAKDVIIKEQGASNFWLKVGLGIGGVGVLGLTIYSFVKGDLGIGIGGVGVTLFMAVLLFK